MAEIYSSDKHYKDIASQIRKIKKNTDTFLPSAMPEQILSLENISSFVNNVTNGIAYHNSKLKFIGDKIYPGFCAGDQTIKEVTNIPSNITTIPKMAFFQCPNLETVTLSDNITTIDAQAFQDCPNFKLQQLPNNLSSLGNSAFLNCKSLQIKEIPKTLKTLPSSAFSNTGLQSLFLPDTITSIGNYAFDTCSYLQKINLENTKITSIGTETFYGCAFNTIIIPKTVTTINQYAFYNCSQLNTIKILNNSSVVSLHTSGVFNYQVPLYNGQGTIYVPSNLLESYKTAAGWKNLYQKGCQFLPLENLYISPIKNYNMLVNSSKVFNVPYYSLLGAVSVNFSYNNTNLSIDNISHSNNNISFTINTKNVTSNNTITLTITYTDGSSYSTNFDISISTSLPEPYYSVENISTPYGFQLNSNNYYESNNKGIGNSYAVAKITFNSNGRKLCVDCINYAESNFDFGLLSNIDSPLSLNNTIDSAVYYSFYGKQSPAVVTVTYDDLDAEEHYIYIKYRKDHTMNTNNDSLQFKIRFED